MSKPKPFQHRKHAGLQLAQALPPELHDSGALVLALPRGGVPAGFAVARAPGLALDILMVRKLGAPGHEEFALGAPGPAPHLPSAQPNSAWRTHHETSD